MATTTERTDLGQHGLKPTGRIHWNLPPAELVEHAVWRGEGQLSADGSFVAVTAPHTGRSPKDKFTVKEPTSEENIAWGDVNVPMEEGHFARLRKDLLAHLNEQDDLYIRDVWAGADPRRLARIRLAFALDGAPWNEERVLERYERWRRFDSLALNLCEQILRPGTLLPFLRTIVMVVLHFNDGFRQQQMRLSNHCFPARMARQSGERRQRRSSLLCKQFSFGDGPTVDSELVYPGITMTRERR